MGTLEIDGLRKEFGEEGNAIIAVEDLDISIENGEFLVLVGPSGCGKSTTLRCIAGLERATSGSIRLDGRDITYAKPRDRGMAMVFQNYALYPHMTVRKNLGYGLKITTDLSGEERAERTEEIAALLEIPDLLEKKPSELSGGQQQRVALGRAIIREPEVFLMDEPLSNLDAKLRTQMRTEIQQLHQNLDVTTIYVTHDQTEAMTMGDRIAVLDGGRLQQVGTPLECYHRPKNAFVAGFIGSPSMNFLDVEYVDGTLEHETFSYDLPPEMAPGLEDGPTQLILGVRPENFELVDGAAENVVRATVEVVEPMGELSYVYLTIGEGSYTMSLDGDVLVENGDDMRVTFPPEKLHLFERATGEALKNSATDNRRVVSPNN